MTLSWIDDRWHLDERPIHAGACVEMRFPDGAWESVRLESADTGRLLFAHFSYRRLPLRVRLSEGDYELRWPGTAATSERAEAAARPQQQGDGR